MIRELLHAAIAWWAASLGHTQVIGHWPWLANRHQLVLELVTRGPFTEYSMVHVWWVHYWAGCPGSFRWHHVHYCWTGVNMGDRYVFSAIG